VLIHGFLRDDETTNLLGNYNEPRAKSSLRMVVRRVEERTTRAPTE
jgi:hypothetical protein